eukprot:TRINITY_DN13365_c0_g1_i1.p1 TRINITY_DN13365_c0_g1~~TRINITY_DN13365_c0_g1_i1.p1  ORF type:complete len:212 (-),score=44.46 TRINITY_DN13365_c0_g1_i1:341-976(-)
MATVSTAQAQVHYDVLLKLLLLGNSGVGKSSIMSRFTTNSFSEHHIATLGIDFQFRTENIAGKQVKMQIWDTAGQERFNSITQSYYRGVSGFLLVYDVTDRSSFDATRRWMADINQQVTGKARVILVGNKTDIPHRVVSSAEGQALAREFGIPYCECSAKSGENIFSTFVQLAEMAVSEPVVPAPTQVTKTTGVDLGNTTQTNEKAKGGCC